MHNRALIDSNGRGESKVGVTIFEVLKEKKKKCLGVEI